MHIPKPTEPKIPDYYFDLGVNRRATAADVKKAFHMLARRHHPDKTAPGKTIDAVEFRQAYEAFEVLRDSTIRSEYDTRYNKVQEEWDKYRSNLAEYVLQEERERLGASHKQARILEEEQRPAETRQREAEEARAKVERTAQQQKERFAEERSRQAAERAQKGPEKRRKQLQKKAEKKKMMIEKKGEQKRRGAVKIKKEKKWVEKKKKKKEQKRVEKRKKIEEKKAERKGKSK
ncbi:unnamed protein product [Alternaria alternata]